MSDDVKVAYTPWNGIQFIAEELGEVLGGQWQVFAGFMPDRPSDFKESLYPFAAVLCDSLEFDAEKVTGRFTVGLGYDSTKEGYSVAASVLFFAIDRIFKRVVDNRFKLAGRHVEGLTATPLETEGRPYFLATLSFSLDFPSYRKDATYLGYLED